MIHALTLGGFIKKCFPNKVIQTNHDSLINNLPLDPKISGMDIVLLQQRDISGFRGEQLLKALKTANSGITILYVYVQDKELNPIKDLILTTKKVNKVNPENIRKAVDAVIEMRQVQEAQEEAIPTKDAQIIERAPEPEPDIIIPEYVPVEPQPLDVPEIVESPKQEEKEENRLSIEERIKQLGAFGDFDFFKHALRKETLTKEIMTENTKYASAVQMLDVLDKEIANVFVSADKSAEDKMTEIKNIALRRAACKEVVNNILVDKFSNVLLAVLESAQATMDRRVQATKEALDKVASSQILYKDTELLSQMVAKRLELQVEIHELQQEIILLYQSMDSSVASLIDSFDEGLPSENQYISETLKVVKPMFTPENATRLGQKLLQDLASGRARLSVMENKLTELIKLIFALCEADTSLIEYQQNLINLLKSNRVEDVVIVDTVLKSCMRLYIGPSEIGTRTTAITWAGIISRRSNCLLLDLSGKAKFKDYGIASVRIEEFLNDRIQEQFVCVEGYVEDDEEKIRDIIMELKMRLNYFPYINVILDPSQKTAIRLFAEDALTAHFITDSTPRSLAIVKNTIAEFTTPNIAKKVVIIDPAVDVIRICNSLGVDMMTTKIITLPYMPRLRTLAFNSIAPHTDKEVVQIFEEAFR